MGFFLTSVDTKRREPVESDFSIRVATVRWSGEAGVLMKTEQAGEDNGITFEAASSRRSLGPHIRSSFYLMLPPSGLLLGFSFLAFLAFLGLGFLDLSLSTEYSLLQLAMLE
ncbi:hypothetical protein AgCh_038646 [Apium graveolens]